MILRLSTLALLLLVAGCVTPQSGSKEAEPAVVTAPRAQVPTPMATQPAEWPALRWHEEVIPAAFTALPPALTPEPARPRPAIVKASRPLQCVPYARELSQIALRGNAWTWWKKAEGRYERGSVPKPGSVLVLSKTRRLRYGHLAYVAEVRNSREIIVHHSNWLNRGRLHRYTPVRDVSKNNDWSVVRVWYTPGQRYGSRHYPAYGFIYPDDGDGVEFRQAAN